MKHKGRRQSFTRRELIQAAAAASLLSAKIDKFASPAPAAPADYWWHHYPSFVQTEDPTQFRNSHARMVIHGCAKDPTWGPFGQTNSRLESAKSLAEMKRNGCRAITWIEGFGDCMLYAAAFNRNPDGTFEARCEDPEVSRVVRSHWDWSNSARGNAIRWVGIHNLVDDEDFCRRLNRRIGLYRTPPTYPDGTPATGVIPGRLYPVNHRIYDACGSKDLNGSNYLNPEATERVNARDPITGMPKGPIEGLYPAVVGKDDVAAPAGAKPGDIVYCGVISVHKDLSAPFWRQWVRMTIKEIIAAGLDGVWCDNYSPWDNFGYPPIRKAFGDWSVSGFHDSLKLRDKSPDMFKDVPNDGYCADKNFDVRSYMKTIAVSFGAKDRDDLNDAAWRDKRWLKDPVWRVFKAYRQTAANSDLGEFYKAIHDIANSAGRPDFCIGGNDVPLYGLGWVRDSWQDMINTETTPGWHMGAGSRGIMIPPLGKMAIMYRAALEHQKGPFSAAWYYLNGGYEKYQQRPEIGKLLTAEAFANGAFLLCMPENKQVCGTLESHAWWNRFVRDNEAKFGRRVPVADAGVLFSPDNQLAQLAPGGYPDIDDQPHLFGHHGWATACIDAHHPYRAITDWKLTSAALTGLRTLVMPHAASLSDGAIAAVATWTMTGGRLILTGSCGSLREPAKDFGPRSTNPFSASLNVRRPAGNGISVAVVGTGSVRWLGTNPGSEYYLKHNRRPELLPHMTELLGKSAKLEPVHLPATVGVSLWRSAQGNSLFADLVNYNLDADRDSVKPATNVAFRLSLPTGWKSLRAETISPDAVAPARIQRHGEWAVVTVPELHHYVSVRLFKF